MNDNELLKDYLKSGLKSRWPNAISKNMLERELVCIENRHLESYFNVAHELIDELKKGNEVLLILVSLRNRLVGEATGNRNNWHRQSTIIKD